MVTNSQADSNFFGLKITFGAASYLVNGASQTGTSLVIDGGTQSIHKGQTFTVAGIPGTYTVSSVTGADGTETTISTTVTTVNFTPALASSPGNNAALTVASEFFLPTQEVSNDITIVNDSSSNAVSIAENSSKIETLAFNLAAGAGLTIEVTNADLIYVKGTTGQTISVAGS